MDLPLGGTVVTPMATSFSNAEVASFGAGSINGSKSRDTSPVSGSFSSRGLAEASSSRQAGPLPAKRGEIGYAVERETDANAAIPHDATSNQDSLTRAARHPADRDAPLPATPIATSDPSSDPSTPPHADAQSTSTQSSSSSTHSSGKRSIISRLKPKHVPTYGGLRLTTLLVFLAQLALIAGSIVAWVFITRLLPKDNGNGFGVNSSQIFAHVAFAIAVLAQCLFLERRIYRLRAERYAYVHPGAVLPTSSSRRGAAGAGGRETPVMGLAPWNRPPLPTYAAALAQSGVGTGDVEDNVIAVPPPPAYGNTRGSTLLLAGFMSETLRAQRVRERARERGVVRGSAGSFVSVVSVMTVESVGERSRPVSYRSSEVEEGGRRDGLRTLRLGETLARLEEGGR